MTAFELFTYFITFILVALPFALLIAFFLGDD